MKVALKRQTVGAVDIQPLTVTVVVIFKNAQTNYIKVKESAIECVSACGTGLLSADHAARAVPRSFPSQNHCQCGKIVR